ncbi:MAG TPA: molecular chaperone TorD family protein [Methylophaga sp.]|nr:molecular chaperone TorD family protein [Methylophaga sp.]
MQDDQQDTAQWRAQIYALLAILLARPADADLLNNIAALKVESPDADMGIAWQQLIVAAKNTNAEAQSREYHQLFIGLTQGEVIPYASYYKTGFLNEKPLADLRADLGKLGLARHDDKKEPEDHVAALCDVMRLILTANGTPVVTAEQFFNQHMGQWLLRFFADLQKATSADFYVAVAVFGQQFFTDENQRFSVN